MLNMSVNEVCVLCLVVIIAAVTSNASRKIGQVRPTSRDSPTWLQMEFNHITLNQDIGNSLKPRGFWQMFFSDARLQDKVWIKTPRYIGQLVVDKSQPRHPCCKSKLNDPDLCEELKWDRRWYEEPLTIACFRGETLMIPLLVASTVIECWAMKCLTEAEMMAQCDNRPTCKGVQPKTTDFEQCANWKMPKFKDDNKTGNSMIHTGNWKSDSTGGSNGRFRRCCNCATNLIIY